MDPAALTSGGSGSEQHYHLAEPLQKQVSPEAATPELPLFGAVSVGDGPLLGRPSAPRPPLAVRRAPEVAKARVGPAASRAPLLDLVPHEAKPVESLPRQPARTDPALVQAGRSQAAAGMIARAAAGFIDLLVLAVVDCAVIYFTIQICGLRPDELGILPKAPLIAFFLIQNGAYLVAFNAGGQTLGKMAVGIKVVSASSGATVDLGRSLLRTLVWALLAAPAGLGFLTALLSRDGRGLHDRFAGTRVVRVGAV